MKKFSSFVKEIVKVTTVFVILSVIFYYSIHWLVNAYIINNKENSPNNSSIKVNTEIDEERTVFNRIIYLFQNGE